MTKTNEYTSEDVQETLKKLLNLKKDEESPYSTTEIKDGEQQDIITETPDDVLDTSIGVREGYLKSIDLSAEKGFYYEVYFSPTNTTAYAKKTYGLGFDYTPYGYWETDTLYKITEETKVKLQSIKDTLQWIIIGVEQEPVIVPGANTMTRGNSQIAVHEDYVTIKGENAEIKIDENEIIAEKGDIKLQINDDGAYVNDKKICLEPCGEVQNPELPLKQALWESPQRSLTVLCGDMMYTYDLDSKKIVNSLQLDTHSIVPFENGNNYTSSVGSLTSDSYIEIDFNYGTIGYRRKYQEIILKNLFNEQGEIILVDENNNIYFLRDWRSLDTPPSIENFEKGDILNSFWSYNHNVGGFITEEGIIIYQYFITDGENETEEVSFFPVEGIINSGFISLDITSENIHDASGVLTTDDGKIKSVSWQWNNSEQTFVIEPNEETIFELPNPKIIDALSFNIVLSSDNKDIYFLELTPTFELIEIASFDEEVGNIMYVRDWLYSGQTKLVQEFIYGVRENYVDAIEIIRNEDWEIIEDIKTFIEFPCSIIDYMVRWLDTWQ